MSRGQSAFGRWVQRVLEADTRYICAACDDRFRCRTEGVEHVLRCHPEFSCVSLDAGSRPSALEPVPARVGVNVTARPLVATPLWN